jgi:proline racemase
MIRQVKTIDAHAAGEPLRLIVDGFPAPRGRTMLDKIGWVRKRQDHLRRALMLEPRGHADMYGALLTEAVSPGAHAGVLFMHNDGYSTMCGHGIIAVTTIVLERGLLTPGGDGRTIVYDSPAGPIRAAATLRSSFDSSTGSGSSRAESRDDRIRMTGTSSRALSSPPLDHARGDPERVESSKGELRVDRVTFTNVPSFVLHGGLAVRLGTRQLRADVAFGGAFYAIVDGEAVGLPLDAAHAPELRRAGLAVKHAIEATHSIVHPLDPALHGIYGTIFTGPPRAASADLRNVTVFADAQIDRSPCGTGTAAVMAVIDAMGLLADDKPFVHESVIGTRFEGRVAGRTAVGDYAAIVPEISGSAWITGEHTFVIDEADPLRDGFRI